MYAFINRFKNWIALKNEARVLEILFICFRENSLIWHSIKLFEMKKAILRAINLEQWYLILIKRFKKRIASTLQKLQSEHYNIADARDDKSFKTFAQNIFRHAKAAKMTFVHNQLTFVWNNLTLDFCQHISEFTSSTHMSIFLNQLNVKINIWQKMTRQDREQSVKSVISLLFKSRFDHYTQFNRQDNLSRLLFQYNQRSYFYQEYSQTY